MYQRPPWAQRTLEPPIMRLIIGVLGRGFDDSRLLEVRGRKTGRLRSTPVKLIRLDGQYFLVSLLGESNWARNLRANPAAALRLGRLRTPVHAVELPVAQRPRVLREYLRLATMRSTPAKLGVSSKEPSDDELRRSAADHPVFRLETNVRKP